MKKRRKGLRLAVGLVFLSAIIVCAAWLVIRHSLMANGAAEKVRTEVQRLVSNSLKVKLTMGTPEIDLLGRVVIPDIQFGDSKEPLLKAEKCVASFNIFSILKNRDNPANVVKKIRILQPKIIILRFPDGTYNFTKLIKSGSGKAAKLPSFPIILSHGSIFYDDRNNENPYPIRHVLLNDFKGRVSLHEEQLIKVELDSSDFNLGKHASIKIKYDMRAGWRIESDFTKTPLGIVNAFFPKSKYKMAGTADKLHFYAEAAFTKIGHPPNFSWGGKAKLSDSRFYSTDNRFYFTELSGNADFSENALMLDGISGKVAGGTIVGYGSITDFKKPVVLARLDFDSVNISSTIRKFFSNKTNLPTGDISGGADISGTLTAPRIVSRIQSPNIAYQGLQFPSCTAYLNYDSTSTSFRIKSKDDEQELTANGAINLSDGQVDSYSLKAQFKGLDIQSAIKTTGIKTDIDVIGKFDGAIAITMKSKQTGTTLFGSMKGVDIDFQGIEDTSFNTGFRYTGGKWIIDNFNAYSGHELLAANGAIDKDGKIGIKISAAVLKTPTALSLLNHNEIKSRGLVSFAGNVNGTLKKPVITGRLDGDDIAVSSMTVERIRGIIKYENDTLNLVDLIAFNKKEKSSANGYIDFGRKNINIDISLVNTPVNSVAGLMKDTLKFDTEIPQDLTGIVNATIKIEGKLNKPTADIVANASNIGMYGETAKSAEFSIAYDKGLNIRKGVINIFGGKITLNGSMYSDKLDLKYTGENLKAEMVEHTKKYKIAGSVAVSGNISGDFDAPASEAEFTSDKFSFRSTEFSLTGGTITYREELFLLKGLKAARDKELYKIEGRYDLASSGMELTVNLDGADLKTIAGFFPYEIPEGTHGPLDGQVRVFTKADQMVGGVQITGKKLDIGKYPIDELTLEARIDGQQINITKFDARNEKSLMEASGLFDMSVKADSQLNIKAYGIELSRLHDMGFVSLPIDGLADVIVDVIGEGGTQKMLGSIESYNPSVAKIGFDRARGQFEFDGKIFNLINLQLLKGKDKLVVYADIPAKKELANQFKIHVNSQRMDISIINPLLADMGVVVGGEASFQNLNVTGSLDDPAFSGEIRISNGAFTQREIRPSVTNIKGEMLFIGSRLMINTLSGNMNDKPVKLRGEVKFNKLVPETCELNVLEANNLYVEYKKEYKGKIDIKDLGIRFSKSSVEILPTTKRYRPTVVVHDGTYTLPPATTQPAQPSKIAVDFGTRNLLVIVGDRFAVQNDWRGMRLEPSGQIQFSGTLTKPSVKGWLTSTRGYINFYTTTFTIKDETVIGFYTIEGIGVVPIFSATAYSRVQGTDITMYASGPMVDTNQYPVYRELCGLSEVDTGNESSRISAGTNTTADITGSSINAPTMALGPNGDIIVPVCPKVKFEAYDENDSSSPALSTQAVFEKLTYMDAFTQDHDLAQALQSGALSVFSPIFSQKISQAVKINYFAVDLDPNKDLLIKLEQQLNNKISVRYERQFSQEIKQNLEVRYEFRKRSFLKWGIDQDNQTDYQVEYRLRF